MTFLEPKVGSGRTTELRCPAKQFILFAQAETLESPRRITLKKRTFYVKACQFGWLRGVRILLGQNGPGCGGPIRAEYTIFEHTLPQRTDPFRRASLRTKRLHAWFRLAGNPGGQPSR